MTAAEVQAVLDDATQQLLQARVALVYETSRDLRKDSLRVLAGVNALRLRGGLEALPVPAHLADPDDEG